MESLYQSAALERRPSAATGRSTTRALSPPSSSDSDSEISASAGRAQQLPPLVQPSQVQSGAPPPAAAAGEKSRAKKPKVRRVIINTSQCRYHVVREAARLVGWIIEDDGREDVPEQFAMTATQRAFVAKVKGYDAELTPQVFWTDVSVLLQRVSKLRCWQRINHFPNMHILSRKMHLFVRLMKQQAIFPTIYDFFPKSWSLRSEMTALSGFLRALKGKPKTFVMKPNGGCQGKGIVLTRNPVKLAPTLPDQDYIVQLYVHRPLLIDGRKFDMRVYVLLLSVTDVQILVHREGLVRICTEPYEKPNVRNLQDAQRHLTNYSVNKTSEAFEDNPDGDVHGDVGNKRDLDFLQRFVTQQQGPDAWIRLVRKIDRAVVLTILSARYELRQVLESSNLAGPKADGRVCFELLGFDIMVNQSGAVFVLEVNHSPSLFCDSPLDTRIKRSVVADVFRMIDPYVVDDPRKASDLSYTKLCASAAAAAKAASARDATRFRQAYPVIDETRNYALCNVGNSTTRSGCSDAEDDEEKAPAPVGTSTVPEVVGACDGRDDAEDGDDEGDDGDDEKSDGLGLQPLTPIGAAYEQEISAEYDLVLGRTTAGASIAAQQLNALIGRNTRPAPETTSGIDDGAPLGVARRGSGGAAAAAAALVERAKARESVGSARLAPSRPPSEQLVLRRQGSATTGSISTTLKKAPSVRKV